MTTRPVWEGEIARPVTGYPRTVRPMPDSLGGWLVIDHVYSDGEAGEWIVGVVDRLLPLGGPDA